jgi:hypothetical protein
MIGFFTAIVFALIMMGDAVAGTDSMCVSDCMMLNNPKEFCMSRCSYGDNAKQSQHVNLKLKTPKSSQTTPQCLKICTEEGSSHQFCQRLCSKLPSAKAEGPEEEPDADD